MVMVRVGHSCADPGPGRRTAATASMRAILEARIAALEGALPIRFGGASSYADPLRAEGRPRAGPSAPGQASRLSPWHSMAAGSAATLRHRTCLSRRVVVLVHRP